MTLNEIRRERRQPIDLLLRPAVFDPHVLTDDIAGFLQTPTKRSHPGFALVRRGGTDVAHHGHMRLLCARQKWPSRRTAKQRNEPTPPHCPPSTQEMAS